MKKYFLVRFHYYSEKKDHTILLYQLKIQLDIIVAPVHLRTCTPLPPHTFVLYMQTSIDILIAMKGFICPTGTMSTTHSTIHMHELMTCYFVFIFIFASSIGLLSSSNQLKHNYRRQAVEIDITLGDSEDIGWKFPFVDCTFCMSMNT